MASIEMKVQPLEVPDFVDIEMPGGETIHLEIEHLDEETLTALIEEFANNLVAKAGKQK